MIYFNQLLRESEIELGRARLVRHQDSDDATGWSLYDLWQADVARFEVYQRIQRKDRFKGSDRIASFIVTPLGETLFVGIYRIEGTRTAPRGTIDPMRRSDMAGHFLHDLALDGALRDHAGRIVVDWGSGFRTWVQRAELRNKPILGIRRRAMEPIKVSDAEMAAINIACDDFHGE